MNHPFKTVRTFAAMLPVIAAAAAIGSVPVAHAQPQDYPSKPINLVVPYTPGGTNDNVARIVSKRLSEKLRQPVVIDYKAGAGGTIGAGFVAAAPADGYTLLNASIGNLAIAPQLVPVRFDPFADLTPIAFVGGARTAVAVNPSLPVSTLQELIAYARAHPGKLSYASSGNGTPGHLAGEYFKQLADVDIRHVPYRGSAQAVADVVAGHVDIAFDPLGNQFVRGGKLRALAFFGGPTAPADLAGVPSIKQAGLADWEDGLAGSFFLVAPSRLPPEVLSRLRTTVAAILREPATVKALADVQVVAQAVTPQQAVAQIRDVHDLARKLIASSKVRQD